MVVILSFDKYTENIRRNIIANVGRSPVRVRKANYVRQIYGEYSNKPYYSNGLISLMGLIRLIFQFLLLKFVKYEIFKVLCIA